MLDLHRLRLLRELDARHTVRAAAEALGYTTSAVSQQLAVLEREAGTSLFERVGRNLQLTEAGLSWSVTRRPCWTAPRQRRRSAKVAAGRVAGVVRVSSFQSAFLRIVAPSVKAGGGPPPRPPQGQRAGGRASAPALRLQHLDVVVGVEYDDQPRPVHSDLARATWCASASGWCCPSTTRRPDAARCRSPSSTPSRGPRASPGRHREMQIRTCRQLGGFEPDLRTPPTTS